MRLISVWPLFFTASCGRLDEVTIASDGFPSRVVVAIDGEGAARAHLTEEEVIARFGLPGLELPFELFVLDYDCRLTTDSSSMLVQP